jgi:hypothetical protein
MDEVASHQTGAQIWIAFASKEEAELVTGLLKPHERASILVSAAKAKAARLIKPHPEETTAN